MFDLESFHTYLKGVNRFYDQFKRKEPNNEKIIWQEGSTKIIDYSVNYDEALPTLLFLPSLINKSYILDLDEELSLVQFFAKKGYRVLLVDFQDPEDNELNMHLKDYVDRLNKAVYKLCNDNPFYIIGYCLGGVLSLILDKPKSFLGQVLIATPVDFSHFQKLFNLNDVLVLNAFKNTIEPMERVPHFLIQAFFSYIDPARIWQKFSQFTTVQNQEEIDKFIKIEQWVNDGVALTKPFCLDSLNLIAENSLQNLLNKDLYDYPSLIINGTEDKIVPIESSLPLYRLITSKEIIIENTGHIGLIISKMARNKTWNSIFKWLIDRT